MVFKTTSIIILSIFFLHLNLSKCQGQGFVTKWETTVPDEFITIPTNPDPSYTYLYNVDWGDGKIDQGVTGDIMHKYDIPDSYIVTITVDNADEFPAIYFNYSGDKNKILSIEQWGNLEWLSMENAFYGCENLELNATDVPILTNVESLAYMFGSCTNFEGNESMEQWNISNVKNIEGIFYDATPFDQDVSFKPSTGAWNTSNVENMSYTFSYTSSFDQDISNWNTSSLNNMEGMFYVATSFDQNIGNWNTSEVTNMNSMFSYAINFNQDISYKPSIDAWNTHKVKDMGYMFDSATSFNHNITNWNTSEVTDMLSMFSDASNFNQDISYKPSTGAWNTAMVTRMWSMFYNAINFDQDIGNWNTSSVSNMREMFKDASTFNQDISNWNFNSLQTGARFLQNTGLSTNNYDRLLQSFVDQNIMSITLAEATGLTYCNITAHDKLTNEMDWEIFLDSQGSPNASSWSMINANWYDDESHWSDMTFPTLCTDVLIPDTKNISIREGQKAMAATLEVELGASLDIPLGAELIVDPQ